MSVNNEKRWRVFEAYRLKNGLGDYLTKLEARGFHVFQLLPGVSSDEVQIVCWYDPENLSMLSDEGL